jgi:hypothetical protein
MQPLIEAAAVIAQEIERTRQHLAKLELALHGLQPLITIDVSPAKLLYTSTGDDQTVEDASMVPVKEVKSKGRRATTGPKTKAKSPTTGKPTKTAAKKHAPESQAIPKTGAVLWKKAIGRKKLSLDEFVTVALGELSLGEESRVQLKNRAAAWLHASVKNGVVESTVGRDGKNRYQVVRG